MPSAALALEVAAGRPHLITPSLWFGAADRVAHEPVVGAERPTRISAGDLDPDLGAGELAGEHGYDASELTTFRDD